MSKPSPIRYTAICIALAIAAATCHSMEMREFPLLLALVSFINGYIATGEWKAKFRKDQGKPKFRPVQKWPDADGRQQP